VNHFPSLQFDFHQVHYVSQKGAIKPSLYVGNSDRPGCSESNLRDSCEYRLTTVYRSSSETEGEFKLSKGTLAEFLSTDNNDAPTWCNTKIAQQNPFIR
jgi:hypothetical protein